MNSPNGTASVKQNWGIQQSATAVILVRGLLQTLLLQVDAFLIDKRIVGAKLAEARLLWPRSSGKVNKIGIVRILLVAIVLPFNLVGL